MAINKPTTQTVISTTAWGIPITDKVNDLDVRVPALEAVNADARLDILETGKLPTVVNIPQLPATASNPSQLRMVTGTGTLHLSDGTRWRTVYGDTGWRDISAALPAADWKLHADTGHFAIRRMNNTVYLRGRIQRVNVAATSLSVYQNLYLITTGFRSSWQYGIYGQGAVTIPMKGPVLFGSVTIAHRFQMYYPNSTYTYAVDDTVMFDTSWATTDVFPATLPGVAWGTIP